MTPEQTSRSAEPHWHSSSVLRRIDHASLSLVVLCRLYHGDSNVLESIVRLLWFWVRGSARLTPPSLNRPMVAGHEEQHYLMLSQTHHISLRIR